MSNDTAPYGQQPPAWWPMIRIIDTGSYCNYGCAFCDRSDTYGEIIGTVETGWMQGRDVCPDCIPVDRPDPDALHPIRVTFDGLARWGQDASRRYFRHLTEADKLLGFVSEINNYMDEHRGEDL